MKKYTFLHVDCVWKEILPIIEPEQHFLLKKSDEDYILAWGIENEFSCKSNNFDLEKFGNFIDQNEDEYRFGYLSYDIKNELEPQLKSQNSDELGFEDTYFFIPQHIIIQKGNQKIYFGKSNPEDIENFLSQKISKKNYSIMEDFKLKPLTPKKEYIENVLKIKEEIQQGNIYEMNYCVNYQLRNKSFNPLVSFIKLSEKTEAPFSAYANLKNHSVLSASPERFIRKKNHQLISEPIKGTIKRGQTKKEDEELKSTLLKNEKEISENVMIVDLVRNDLSKIAMKNSVKVDRLCDLQSFNTVHQLISTVSCQVKNDESFSKIIESLFPMGSMTGAPKFSAMEIAEKYENFKRGLYSGSIGFIEPNGNFDFNVVIRSILHKKSNHLISCSVGGAITIKSEDELEYQECILKLEALKESLC